MVKPFPPVSKQPSMLRPLPPLKPRLLPLGKVKVRKPPRKVKMNPEKVKAKVTPLEKTTADLMSLDAVPTTSASRSNLESTPEQILIITDSTVFDRCAFTGLI